MTFLITYYAHPEMLRACVDSIRKFHPDSPIIISQQEGDMQIPDDITGYKLIMHNMMKGTWADVCIGLMNECKSGVGVFIEHDCVLLKPVGELVEKLDEYDLIGVEEVTEDLMRNSKGFANQNFFMLDVGKFLKKNGSEAVRVDINMIKDIDKLKNIESAYGVTQHSDKIYWLPIKSSGYAHGTFYGDFVHHMWYGSYRQRNVSSDGVDYWFMEDEVNRFLKDYSYLK